MRRGAAPRPERAGARGWASPCGTLLVVLGAVLAAARPLPAIHVGAEVPLSIAPDDLQRYREAGEIVTVIDLRPIEAYRKAHVAGARSIPLGELRRQLSAVPRAGRVALYATTAEEAGAAYQALREAGYRNVMVLVGGLGEWTRLRLPVETTP